MLHLLRFTFRSKFSSQVLCVFPSFSLLLGCLFWSISTKLDNSEIHFMLYWLRFSVLFVLWLYNMHVPLVQFFSICDWLGRSTVHHRAHFHQHWICIYILLHIWNINEHNTGIFQGLLFICITVCYFPYFLFTCNLQFPDIK